MTINGDGEWVESPWKLGTGPQVTVSRREGRWGISRQTYKKPMVHKTPSGWWAVYYRNTDALICLDWAHAVRVAVRWYQSGDFGAARETL